MKQRFFFEHYGLTEHDLEHYLAAALSAGGDYADLYFEYLSSTSLMVDESMVKSASQGISAGCGVRVVSGERTGYAYTDDLSSARILHAARTAALIASAPAKTTVAGFQKAAARSLYPVTLPSVDAEISAKVELVMRADKAARAYDPRIQEVRASYADELRNILVVGSDGTFAEDSQPLARMNVSCIAKTEGNSARGNFRRRRTRRSRFLLRREDSGIFRQGIGAAGDSATRRPRGSGGRHGSGARSRMARRAAARSRRSRTGSRLQSQEDFGVRRTDRQARGQRKMHRRRQRHHAVAPRFAQRRRRRRAHAGNRADRKRNSEGLPERQAFRRA